MSSYLYDRLMTILGVGADQRYRLFFSVIRHESQKKSQTKGYYYEVGTVDLVNNVVFGSSSGISENEKKAFYQTLIKQTDPGTTQASLNSLKELTNVDTTNFSHDAFTVFMVKFLLVVSGPSGELTDHTKWGSATTLTLRKTNTPLVTLGWIWNGSSVVPMNNIAALFPLTADSSIHTTIVGDTGLTQNTKGWNYKVDKYTIKRLYDALTQQSYNVVSSSQTFFNDAGTLLYFRDAKGQLRDANNNKVGRESEAFKSLTASKGCYTTQFVSGSNAGTKCQDYIDSCLLGNSIAECASFMKESSYWNVLGSDIAKMNPEVALQTLRKFGFKVNNGKEVESYGEWSEKLSTQEGMDSSDVDQIRKNSKLEGYLKGVIALVNSNPVIISNRNNNPQVLKSTPFGKYGIKSKEHYVNVNLSTTSMHRLANAVATYNRSVGLSWGLNMGASTILLGGSAPRNIQERVKTYNNVPKYLSSELRRYYDAFKNRLRAHNKTIASSDDSNVHKLLNQLADSERKLYKTMMFAEKYATLIDLFESDNSGEVLNFDTLKKFVDTRDKYFLKSTRRQADAISMITQLSQNVDSALGPRKTNL
jgi:hypothetical protein